MISFSKQVRLSFCRWRRFLSPSSQLAVWMKSRKHSPPFSTSSSCAFFPLFLPNVQSHRLWPFTLYLLPSFHFSYCIHLYCTSPGEWETRDFESIEERTCEAHLYVNSYTPFTLFLHPRWFTCSFSLSLISNSSGREREREEERGRERQTEFKLFKKRRVKQIFLCRTF